MSPEPVFDLVDGRLVATELASGPWDRNAQIGARWVGGASQSSPARLLMAIENAKLTVVDEKRRMVFAWYGASEVRVYDEDGEPIVHGYCDGTETEVLFELQNLTEVGPEGFRAQELYVGLCGLAYRARVSSASRGEPARWQTLEEAAPSRAAHENDWSLAGRVVSFKPLRNPLSGGELYWVYLDLERLKLEVLINRRALRGDALSVGATLSAEVWLQGHVLDRRALLSRYEGRDATVPRSQLWSHLRRRN